MRAALLTSCLHLLRGTLPYADRTRSCSWPGPRRLSQEQLSLLVRNAPETARHRRAEGARDGMRVVGGAARPREDPFAPSPVRQTPPMDYTERRLPLDRKPTTIRRKKTQNQTEQPVANIQPAGNRLRSHPRPALHALDRGLDVDEDAHSCPPRLPLPLLRNAVLNLNNPPSPSPGVARNSHPKHSPPQFSIGLRSFRPISLAPALGASHPQPGHGATSLTTPLPARGLRRAAAVPAIKDQRPSVPPTHGHVLGCWRLNVILLHAGSWACRSEFFVLWCCALAGSGVSPPAVAYVSPHSL